MTISISPVSTPLRVGLVGLGLMGRGMGLSLLRAGHALGVVAHRRRETADELVAAGAWRADSPAALAAACDAIVLCLPSEQAVEQVLLGDGGVAAAGCPGLLVIECSTLMPQAGRHLAAALAPAGIDFVDAPVTRGPAEAVAGRLNALLGGTAAAADRAEPVLQAFCERVFRFDGVGQGYAAKLINNFLAFSNLVAVAEAMATASRAGLPMPMLLDAIHAGGGQNRVLDGLAPWLADGSPTRSRVTLTTAHKDADYYRQFAGSLHSAGPVAATTAAQLAGALGAGLGDSFTQALLDHVSQQLTHSQKKTPT